MEKIGRARSLYRSIFHSSRGYIATSSNNQLLAAGLRNYHLSTLPKRLSPGQERNMYISATPSPLPLNPNPVNPVKVGSFDRDERPPTTNAFQEITGCVPVYFIPLVVGIPRLRLNHPNSLRSLFLFSSCIFLKRPLAIFPHFGSWDLLRSFYRVYHSPTQRGNLGTKGKVEEAGGHNHNTMTQIAKHTEEMERGTIIRKGYLININELLFTKNRDYLIRYNDGPRVKAEELANKLIAVYFVPLLADYLEERLATTHLIDTYNYLLPHNVFEVVLVAYEADKIPYSSSNINPEKQFEAIFSHMPWTAIPFSDITSRECLFRRFGIHRFGTWLHSFVIDSTGMVLQTDGLCIFKEYGGLGYPFTDARIQYLESLDAALVEQPSLKMLLASPRRDYVISNKGDKVPIDTLEDKVVALYFYEEGKTPNRLTADIELVYKESAKMKKEFEVVLIYLYDTVSTCGNTNEESFYETFKSMPWLALPFKDPAYKKLKRFFGHNDDDEDYLITPSLVIFGPDGKFVEPWGADILENYKLAAYPFSREKVAQIETENIRELRMEMLWDRNTVFRRNEGTEIQLTELGGKRIVLFFEGKHYKQYAPGFLNLIKSSYARMEGTDEEFEVIYITSRKKRALYEEIVSDVPWLFAHESELLTVDLSLYCCYCLPKKYLCQCSPGWCGKSCTLLAFDRDGKLVSKIMHPYVSGCTDFPFGDADMEKEALLALHVNHGWDDLDEQYSGLRGPVINYTTLRGLG